MYRSILVPLDGTAMAQHALLPAADIARRGGGRLALVVVHPIGPAEDAPTIGSRDDEVLRDDEDRYLKGLRACVATFGVPVEIDLLRGGDVVPALAAYAQARQVDLVVGTTHGRGAIARLLLGGTALRLAHELRCPMLLIKPLAVDTRELPAGGPRRIAIALDGSARAETAIPAALALSAGSATDCLLIRAIRLPLHARTLGALRQESERYLTQLARRLEGRGHLHLEWRAPLSSTPATALRNAATRWRADVLALATRERSDVRRTVLGSVADELVRTAPLPVLVCHAEPAAQIATLTGGS
jgi:nucleotide-binding universal stress UspA family protein